MLFSSITTKLALIGVAVALVGGVVIGWHECALREPAKIEAQKLADTKSCSAAQAITKGENDALQNDHARIAADLARYKRLHPDSCLYFTESGQLQSAAGQHANLHGISTGWLRDYAALCETLRSELSICTTGEGPFE